jgi:2-iminobutanoate/2-iminopropanoate deaminase
MMHYRTIWQRLGVLSLIGLCSLWSISTQAAKTALPHVIYTSGAPEPIGAYSQGRFIADTLYLSGQIGTDPQTGQLVNTNIHAETEQVMANLQAILAEAGMEWSDVVSTTIYLTDLDHFKVVNTVYSKYFDGVFPARVTVQVAGLPGGARIEISMIAHQRGHPAPTAKPSNIKPAQ